MLPAAELRVLARWLEDRLFGLGELAPLLRDDRVSEVMVNGTRGVWVERDGGEEIEISELQRMRTSVRSRNPCAAS